MSRNLISLILSLLLIITPTLCFNHTQHSNKVCFLLLYSRRYRESDEVHHRYITTNDGTIRRALNIYKADTLEPFVTVVDYDVDALIDSISGIDERGKNRTYVPNMDYCSYMRIMRSKTHKSANLEERRVIEQYDKYHRRSNQLETVETEEGKEKLSLSCTTDTNCTRYGDSCEKREVEVCLMNTETCKGLEGGDVSRGTTCARIFLIVIWCKVFGVSFNVDTFLAKVNQQLILNIIAHLGFDFNRLGCFRAT